MTTSSSDYARTVWLSTLALNLFILALVWFLHRPWLLPLAMGMGLGQLYLFTLALNAGKPGKPFLQVAISLTRVAITAYAVVILANAQHALPVAEAAALEIAGCFSYKVIVAILAIRHIQSHLRGISDSNGTSSLDHH